MRSDKDKQQIHAPFLFTHVEGPEIDWADNLRCFASKRCKRKSGKKDRRLGENGWHAFQLTWFLYICGEGPHSLLQVIGLDKRQRESRYGGWGTGPEELAWRRR
jgi:hypothetical protein